MDLLTEQRERDRLIKQGYEEEAVRGNLAQSVIQRVAQETQATMEIHISEIVSRAMRAVWDEPYHMDCKFVLRRGKTECDLNFTRNGNSFDPITEAGGGCADVAAFALRVALWSLSPTRPVLFLDEPFRFVSRNLQERCSELLRETSHRMGLQIVVVSHDPRLQECADKAFTIEKVDGVSVVK